MPDNQISRKKPTGHRLNPGNEVFNDFDKAIQMGVDSIQELVMMIGNGDL